jgi:hypothetical protein
MPFSIRPYRPVQCALHVSLGALGVLFIAAFPSARLFTKA